MRYLALKIIAVFCVLVASLFGWKWHTWFGNPTENKYITSCIPNRVMLSLGEDADCDRSISWRCNLNNPKGWTKLVELSTNDTIYKETVGKIVKSEGGKSTFHRANFKNLRYGKYRYQIGTKDRASRWREFFVNKVDNAFSFLYMGDIQDEINGVSDTIFNHINNKYPDLDFWMFAGDMVERPLDMYWNEFISSGKGIFDRKPIIACTGNHEYHKGIFKKLDKRWVHYWPLPKNGPCLFKGRVCHWEIENACIISLDTDGIQGIGTYFSQYYWAKRILNKTTKPWKIVFLHHPLKSAGKGRSTIIMRTLFKDMLAECGVDVVLQGHDHSYSRYTTKEDGVQKSPVYVVSSCSRKAYDIAIDNEADRLASKTKLYQLINVTKNKLTYNSYCLNDELYDSFSLVRNDNLKSFVEEKPDTKEILEPTYRLHRKKNKDKLEEYMEEVNERQSK